MKNIKLFNKLVRDRIPEIIQRSGSNHKTRTLPIEEFSSALNLKLQEEVNEFLEAKTKKDKVEEIADILEVIRTLLELENTSMDEVEKIRLAKIKDKGAFSEKKFLIEVERVY